MRPGFEFSIAGNIARVTEILEDGSQIVEFDSEPDLVRFGRMPIPPYPKRSGSVTASSATATAC
jgi:hypothetical protein